MSEVRGTCVGAYVFSLEESRLDYLTVRYIRSGHIGVDYIRFGYTGLN